MKRTVPLLVLLAAPAVGQEPILDMHLHAMGANDQGPPPIAICAPFATFPSWDQRQSYPAVFMKDPPCDDPLWSLETDEALRDGTIEVMRRLNVFGVLSGPTWRVKGAREDFYRYLRAMIDAGFEDRIMFGSDQMNWPDAIERAVQTIADAPFLTASQKRNIFYDNAARFLRLTPGRAGSTLGSIVTSEEDM